MPYKRRYRKKKKSYGGRKFNNAVRSVISKQTETKSLGQEQVEQVITSATAAFILSLSLNPVEGTGPDDRIGDTIKGIGYHYNYILTSTVAVDQVVRVIVYVSNENFFDDPADALLLTVQDIATAPVAEQLIDIGRSFNKKSNIVLSDTIHKLNANNAGLGNRIIMRKKLLKFNHKRVYDAGSGESKGNNIRFLILNRSIDNDATTVTCELTLASKYYYQDY